jgi:hypothetical protein
MSIRYLLIMHAVNLPQTKLNSNFSKSAAATTETPIFHPRICLTTSQAFRVLSVTFCPLLEKYYSTDS